MHYPAGYVEITPEITVITDICLNSIITGFRGRSGNTPAISGGGVSIGRALVFPRPHFTAHQVCAKVQNGFLVRRQRALK